MKHLTITAALICMVCIQQAHANESLTFTNQTITVKLEQLSLESVEYDPGGVVTNTASEWVPYIEYHTNNFHNPPLITVNSNAQRQVLSEVVTTNAPGWMANVLFELPKGHQWELNRYPVSVDRFKIRIEVACDPAAVSALFGEAYPGLLFAATNGRYQPTGQVRDGFLQLGAQALSAATGQ